MRHFIALFVLATLLVPPSPAQTVRIATWQVRDLPMPLEAAKNPLVDEDRLNEIAATLSSADADVIILYGIPDSDSAKKVASLMTPQKYSVAVHSLFRHNWPKGPIVGQPFCILSRKQKMSGRSIDWWTTGRIDMPGGFAFATFRHRAGDFAVYVAELPGSLTNGVTSADAHYYGRKRNYAAQFLTHHTSWVASTYTNELFATYIAGDINLSPRSPIKDDGAKLLELSGFKSASPGAALDKSAIPITDTLNADWVLNSIFTRGVEFMATRQISKPSSQHPLVTCDLTLKSSGVASAPAAPARKTPAAPVAATPAEAVAPLPLVAVTPAPTHSLAIDRRWLWGGAAAAGVVAIALLRRRTTRRRRASMALSRRANDAMFVEFGPPAAMPRESALNSGRTTGFSESTTVSSNAQQALWPSLPLNGEPQNEPAAEARAGLIPHLSRLMREKLFVWLSSQRSQLLDSHETGTKQVLSLEERLERIQGRFQHRLIAQEQRIAELEKDVQTKEKIIQSLPRTQTPSDESANG